MKNLILIFLILSVIAITTNAHEGKKHEKTKKDTTIVLADSLKHNDGLIDHQHMSDEQVAEFDIKIPDMLFEHPHNKIVHFTVALSLAAFLFTLLNFKWRQFDWTIKILVLISAMAGVAAYFTGSSQAVMFEGKSVEWVVELHRTYGIISAIALWVWSIILFLAPIKKYAWIIGAIICILISITGFYGGIVATS